MPVSSERGFVIVYTGKGKGKIELSLDVPDRSWEVAVTLPGRYAVSGAVRGAVTAIPGVLAVHALHVWSITTGMDALSAHVVVEEGRPHLPLLKELRTTLHDRFGTLIDDMYGNRTEFAGGDLTEVHS